MFLGSVWSYFWTFFWFLPKKCFLVRFWLFCTWKSVISVDFWGGVSPGPVDQNELFLPFWHLKGNIWGRFFHFFHICIFRPVLGSGKSRLGHFLSFSVDFWGGVSPCTVNQNELFLLFWHLKGNIWGRFFHFFHICIFRPILGSGKSVPLFFVVFNGLLGWCSGRCISWPSEPKQIVSVVLASQGKYLGSFFSFFQNFQFWALGRVLNMVPGTKFSKIWIFFFFANWVILNQKIQ